MTNEPFFAKQAGVEVRTLMISASGYDPYRVSFTTREFAAAHPDVVAKFVRASIRGWLAYLSDPSATNEYLLEAESGAEPAAGGIHGTSAARWGIHHRRRRFRRANWAYDSRTVAINL